MVIRKVVRASALAATSLGMVASLTGIAGASTGSGVLSVTGPDSSNQVLNLSKLETMVTRTNSFTFGSQNTQAAFTGSAATVDNTSGGGALSGDASNTKSQGVNVTVANTVPSASPVLIPSNGSGSIGYSGPGSDNRVTDVSKTLLSDTDTNSLALTSSNNQFAASGSAIVAHNTLGGNAISGNAMNNDTEMIGVNLTNQ